MQSNNFSTRNDEELDNKQMDTEASDVLFAISVVARNLARNLKQKRECEADDDQHPS